MADSGSLTSDVRYAIRTLRSGRLFTAVAVGCLALGIATNTTMFSVFDAMFLRPLPFVDADRLVAISGRHPETGRRVSLSVDDARELTTAVAALEDVAVYTGRSATLADGGEPERVDAGLVTANLFELLGEHSVVGRNFQPADDLPAAAGVALISDALWRRRYLADRGAVGRLIHLDAVPYEIVGVMPRAFRFPSTTDVWIPLVPGLGASGMASGSVSIVGRRRPDVTLERVNAELAARVVPPSRMRGPRTALARAFRNTGVGGEERTITIALMGATTVLLLIVCVNVANLLLARGAGRRREIAVRAALGASRGRIIRLLVTEAMLLAALAGLVAVPLIWYGIGWVHDAVPATDPLGPYYMDWAIDARTLTYTVGVALATGMAFGLAPAFDAAGRRLFDPLRDGAGTSSGRAQRRVHDALIVAEIALALVLLSGAAVFVRTYAGLRNVRLGYDTSHLMTMRFYLAGPAYDTVDARVRAVDDIAERLRLLPGAEAATVTDLVPLDDQGGSDAPADVEGRPFAADGKPTVHYAGVAGRWPETFDLTLDAGRSFHDEELRSASPVALVNEKLASTFWPNQNPLGRRFRLAEDGAGPWLSVIGVVPDIRTVKLDENQATPPTAWVPHRFMSTRNYGIVVRTAAGPESVTAAVRTAVRAVDPGLALFDIYPMEQVRWLSYWMYVMWGTLFGVFAIIALAIAAVGVYGVVFYTAAQRTREIGLRVALGARRAQVVGPMLRQVAGLSVLGLVIGLVATLAVMPLVGSLLIGVTPDDPATLAEVAGLLLAVALAATWLPAWRASAVDPTVALREG